MHEVFSWPRLHLLCHVGRSTTQWMGLLLLMVAVEAAAQERPIFNLEVSRTGAERVVIALEELDVDSPVPEATDAATMLAGRLLRDLVYSGWVAMLEPLPSRVSIPGAVPGAATTNEVDRVGARLSLRLSGVRDDQMVWEARLVQAAPRAQLLGKRYVLDLDAPIRHVHHLADQIVRELTGEPGLAQTRVLFSRKIGQGRELFLVDYDGDGLRQITRNGSLNLLPRWSPDGNRICYTSYWKGKQRLLVLDGSTGKSQKIAEYSGLNLGAAWSPDGEELVVTLSRDGNPEIYRILPDGTVRQRLSFETSIECSPMFDPTGHQVVYTSDRTGAPQIYVTDREGSRRRRLSLQGRYNESAAWSPRGDRIAFVSRRNGHFQVFVVAPDASELRAVTATGDGNNEDPAWAPDGRHLVVSSDRDGTRRLWVIDVDSGFARPLTNGPVDDNGPHWGPPPRTPSGAKNPSGN
jgi:TolB protein